MIRVLVNGALGRMGSEVCKKVYSEADLELVGAVDIKEGTVPLGDGVELLAESHDINTFRTQSRSYWR